MAHLLAHELAQIPGNAVTLAAHTGEATCDNLSEEGYARMPIRASNLFEKRLGVPLLLPHPADVRDLIAAARAADVLLVHDSVYLSNLAAIAGAHRQTRSIVIKHTGEVRFYSRLGQFGYSAFNRLLAARILRHADALAFVTSAKLENSDPIAGPLTTVIANGIDTEVFAPSGEPRDGSLLFAGRFVTKKGVGIIREMARLMPDRRFVLAGYGPVDPRNWQANNVTCHWRPHPRALAALYSTCSACILPGETEGTPLVALEALACEAPTVIGERGLAPDMLLDQQMSRLPVDTENPKETARVWCARLDDAVARSKPDRGAIISHYSAQRMARDYLSLIEQVMARAS